MSAVCRGARKGPGRGTAWSTADEDVVGDEDDGDDGGALDGPVEPDVPSAGAADVPEDASPQAASASTENRHATTAAR
jgi:hypothetical protein